MASVMAEALDEQQVHIPKVSKYENLTALAKTLKEDPSCQLCSALKRYVFKKGVSDIETNLDAKVRGWIFFTKDCGLKNMRFEQKISKYYIISKIIYSFSLFE